MSDTAKKQVRKLKIIEDDPNLSAFEGDLNERVRHFKQRKKELLAPGQTLTEFASGICITASTRSRAAGSTASGRPARRPCT